MQLTQAQKQTLKAFILADGVLAPLATSFEYSQLADALNAEAAPAFYLWKSRLSLHEVTDEVSPAGTSFDWASAGGYIARSQGERDCWRQIWNTVLSVNPSKPNVRAAFNDIFSGSGAGAVNNRTHLDSMSKRKATICEKLFADTASGNGGASTPAQIGVEGLLIPQEMASIMAS